VCDDAVGRPMMHLSALKQATGEARCVCVLCVHVRMSVCVDVSREKHILTDFYHSLSMLRSFRPFPPTVQLPYLTANFEITCGHRSISIHLPRMTNHNALGR